MPTASHLARRARRLALTSETYMRMLFDKRAVIVGLAAMVALGACAQNSAPNAGTAPTLVAQAVATAGTIDPRMDPTAAVGGGINVSNAISPDDVVSVFKTLPQASQFKLSANSSPAGARGGDVQSVSVIGQDTGGVLKGLDAAGKRTLGDALLGAASVAWPNASVSLLISDPGGAGQIIGSHAPGSANTIIVSPA